MLISVNRNLRGHIAAWVAFIMAIENFCLYGAVVSAAETPIYYRMAYETEGPSTYVNVSEYPGELCNRECVRGDERVCYFDFTLEYYQAVGVACGDCMKGVEEDCDNPQCIVADGVEKGVMSINRQIPGPPIHVCKDDLIVVDVRNHAHGTAAALHWHGVHMKDTPYMDGVPFLTQCPIPFNTAFRYEFRATEAGTHFYHSHSGHHKVNGQFGALIIRRPREAYSYVNYDYDLPEHYMIINDWMHVYAEEHLPSLPNSLIWPDSVLINGRGLFTDPRTRKQVKAPPTIYYVKPGYRYRFRIINSGNHICPFQVQIESHYLTVIASDSFDVLPYPTETLVTNSGERYDFIVNANYTGGDFLIRVRGIGVCEEQLIESFAVLRYQTYRNKYVRPVPKFPKYEDISPSSRYLNHPNTTCEPGQVKRCITDMIAVDRDLDLENATPDYKFYLAFDNVLVPNDEVFRAGEYTRFINTASNRTIMASINHIGLTFPHYPPLTQPEFIDESQFCNIYNIPAKCSGKTVCACTHRLKVKLNSIVELIIVDETDLTPANNPISHPFHLHGYRFIVTGMGRDPSGMPMSVNRAKYMDDTNRLPRFSFRSRPPFKDTVSIPSSGFAAVRLRATNPGFWLMHCHYDWHLSNGMGLILQVGETSQMVKPPSDFPKCGDYLRPVKVKSSSKYSNVKTSINYYQSLAYS